MDSNECLIFSPLDFLEILSGDINEHIQHLQENLVSAVHDLLVMARVGKCYFCISCPNELNAQDPNLKQNSTCKLVVSKASTLWCAQSRFTIHIYFSWYVTLRQWHNAHAQMSWEHCNWKEWSSRASETKNKGKL